VSKNDKIRLAKKAAPLKPNAKKRRRALSNGKEGREESGSRDRLDAVLEGERNSGEKEKKKKRKKEKRWWSQNGAQKRGKKVVPY